MTRRATIKSCMYIARQSKYQPTRTYRLKSGHLNENYNILHPQNDTDTMQMTRINSMGAEEMSFLRQRLLDRQECEGESPHAAGLAKRDNAEYSIIYDKSR